MPKASRDRRSARSATRMGWPGTVRLGVERWGFDVAPEGLRNVTLDGRAVLTALYAAVRAPNWATLAEDNVREQAELTAFGVILRREGTLGGSLHSTLVVEGGADGLLRVRNVLEVHGSVQLNRWGLNACIEAETWEGATAVTGEGEASLPRGIAPQFRLDGVLQGIFPASAVLLLRGSAGLLRLTSRGQVIEVEDQRNWSEPTYKIYSGALREPRPQRLRAGDRLLQELSVRYLPPKPRVRREPLAGMLVAAQRPLLKVGVQVNDGVHAEGDREGTGSATYARLVDALRVDHVRVDLPAAGPLPPGLEQVFGLPVELAALLDDLGDSTLDDLVAGCLSLPRDSRVLVHLSRRRTTSHSDLSPLLTRLRSVRPDLAIVPGTDAYFADLARDRSPLSDTVSFSIVPTVHQIHDENLFATVPVQERLCQEVVRRGGTPVVSPVTLRLRGDPEGQHDAATRADMTVHHVDPRLRELEAAAWTLGSVVALVRGGAASGTWHELLGARGLVDVSRGEPSVTPTFHVLAALRARTRPFVRPVTSGSYQSAGLLFPEDRRSLLASLRPWALEISLSGVFAEGQLLQRRRLKAGDDARATLDWWSCAPVAEVSAEGPLELEPFEVTELRAL